MAAVAEKEAKDKKTKNNNASALQELNEDEIQEVLDKLTGPRKAAILLVALGSHAASAVLRCLNDAEVELISVEIAGIRNMKSEVVEAVLTEFKDLGLAQDFVSQGGLTYARDALSAAVGPRRAEEIMMRVEAAMEVSAFHLLQTVETGQLTNFLQSEHPQTAALIIANLNPRKSAEIISKPGNRQTRMKLFTGLQLLGKPRRHFSTISKKLFVNKLALYSAPSLVRQVGIESVAQILNSTSRNAEKNILEALSDRGPRTCRPGQSAHVCLR